MGETQATESVSTATPSTLDFPFVVTQLNSPQNRAFIADSWTKTLRGSTKERRKAQESSFFGHFNKHVDALLDDELTRVRIATPPGDELMLYGYLVHRPPDLLHMLYVKVPFRRRGIARRLLEGVEVKGAVLTQWSADLADWILPKLSRVVGRDRFDRPRYETGVVYNPYWLEENK